MSAGDKPGDFDHLDTVDRVKAATTPTDTNVSTAIAQQIAEGERERLARNAHEDSVVCLHMTAFPDKDGKPTPLFLTYREASMLHFELGKLLTRLATPATKQDGTGQETT